ncbi:MAG: DUF4293 domain-containing protein [Chitinophagales bacterium]|nr:DUF4293 domain-containing protein [Chitinophagales bacterium]
MIQRVQTVYLALAAIFVGIFLGLPLFSYNNGEVVYTAFHSTIGLACSILFIIATVGVILMYKNRPLQIKLTGTLIVLLAIVAGIYKFQFFHYISINYHPTLKAGLFMLLFSLIFLFLAIRNIRKDEKLVRSSDRLR